MHLNFNKLAKHTFHPRLPPAPLPSEAGKEALLLPCRACWPHSPHPYWRCGAQLGSPQRLPQHHGTGSAEASSKATETFDLRGKVERCLHLANSKSKLQQASLANHTSQTKAEYKVASRAAHKSALAAYHHHFTQLLTKVQRSMHEGNTHPTYRSSGNLASPNVSLAGSCGMASLAGSFVQLLSALLNGFNTSFNCSPLFHPLFLRCWHYYQPQSPIRPPLPKGHAG
ncbi:TPA: hypothetical protein ACH3X2_013927 [Trebouxia sp. C0005]